MAVVLFKVFLAFDGYVDHLGRGPVEHLTSAFFQFLFVLGLVWLGKKYVLHKSKKQKAYSRTKCNKDESHLGC